MVVARLIRAEFPQALWQIETQNLAEIARRVAGRDQLIGEEEPERLFAIFKLWQAQMLQMDLPEAFVALPQSFDACRNLTSRAALTGAEKVTVSSARMRSSPERSSLPASPPPRRIEATQVPAPSMGPASVKTKDRLGGRCLQSARNACSKRSMAPTPNSHESIQCREGGCVDGSIVSKTKHEHLGEVKLCDRRGETISCPRRR
jgi:hypothetical protein